MIVSWLRGTDSSASILHPRLITTLGPSSSQRLSRASITLNPDCLLVNTLLLFTHSHSPPHSRPNTLASTSSTAPSQPQIRPPLWLLDSSHSSDPPSHFSDPSPPISLHPATLPPSALTLSASPTFHTVVAAAAAWLVSSSELALRSEGGSSQAWCEAGESPTSVGER